MSEYWNKLSYDDGHGEGIFGYPCGCNFRFGGASCRTQSAQDDFASVPLPKLIADSKPSTFNGFGSPVYDLDQPYQSVVSELQSELPSMGWTMERNDGLLARFALRKDGKKAATLLVSNGEGSDGKLSDPNRAQILLMKAKAQPD